ncbi:MAG TPA: hypothetical protein VF229_07640, partial [Burkholderiaceae bacterium]
MPESREQPSVLTNSGLALIVAVAAGAFVAQQVPWKGARPTEAAAKVSRYAALEDIDARQWQDPLGAVMRGIEERRRRGEGSPDAETPRAPARGGVEGRHEIDQFASVICGSGEPVPTVIGVMVPGGPYPDYAENRRRARYAVLAALSEAGFVPDDPEHIGYLRPRTPDAQSGSGANGELAAGVRLPPEQAQLPAFIPYEWLARDDSALGVRRAPAARAAADTGKQPFAGVVPARWPAASRGTEVSAQAASRTLVLWLDGNFFAKGVAEKIAALQARLAPACLGLPPRIAILGPGESTLLSDLVGGSGERNLAGPHGPAGPPESEGSAYPIRFYDYASSVDTDRILDPVGRAPGHGFAQGERFVVLRTMGTDSSVSKTLYRELLRREAVSPFPVQAAAAGRAGAGPRHVVLISERDTLYGRNLPGELMRELTRCNAAAPACSPQEIERWANWIHRFTYLRGLDGQQPEYQAAPEGHESRQAGAIGPGAAAEDRQIEQAAGQAQLDYLRRVAERLTALQEDLQQKDPPQSIGAIGVLGS